MNNNESVDGTDSGISGYRREFLQGVGVTGIAGVTAGCLGGDGDDNGGDNGGDNGDDNGSSDQPNGNGDDAAFFEVGDLDPAEATVDLGGSVDVSTTITNTGDLEGTQTIELAVGGELSDSAEVTLAGGESGGVSLGLDTADLEPGEHDFTVTSEDDEATGALTIAEPEAYFDVSALEPGDVTVEPGSAVDVSATVENMGDVEGTQDVTLHVGNDEVDSTELTLDEGGSEEVSFELDTGGLAPQEHSYAVASDDDEVGATLSIEFAGQVETPWGLNNGNEGGDFDPVQIDDVIFDDALPGVAIPHGEQNVSVRTEDQRDDVEGTEYDALYYTENWGSDIGYDIPVPESTYFVTFHWAETWHGEDGSSGEGGEGSRVFDLSINGNTVLEEFDIYAEAGGAYTAISRTFTVFATDGVISIETETVEDATMFNGIEIRRAEHEVPLTGGGVAEEPAFTLEPGTHQFTNMDGEANTETADDLSADFYFGYDEDNLYLQADVTDDSHTATGGEGMWEFDNIQYAAGIDGTYGPEDGITHVDGEADTFRWHDGEAREGIDAVDATTSREGDTTTYEATIPWAALLPEDPGPGDSFRFSVQVNESDEGETRDAVLGWTLPGINADKSYEALGTFVLEDTIVEAPWGLNAGGEPVDDDGNSVAQSPTPVIKDGIVFDSDLGAAVDVHHNPDTAPEWYDIPEDTAMTSHTDAAIEGTEHDALYQSELFGPDLGFDIGIENGVYDVILHFAETNDGFADGGRTFDLSVQGETVLEAYEPGPAAGGLNVATSVVVEGVEVTDNTLSIGSTSINDLTKYSGIEIRRSTMSAPFGIDSGGEGLEGTVEIDGLEFVDVSSSPYVDVYASDDPEDTSTPDTVVGTYTVENEIEGTDYDELYQTEHNGGNLGYDVYLENGTYDVTLHFAETNEIFTDVDRIFDVHLNGTTVLSEYNIAEEVGVFVADTHTFTVEVTDNVLEISSETIVDNTKFAAIEIRESSGGGGGGGDVTDGLLGHWSFDDDGVQDGTVVDQSGNGHDGEIIGDVTTGVDAPVGSAAEFVADNEETVLVPHAEELNPPAYSVSVWMQSEELDEWRALVAKEDSMWCGIEGASGNNTARMDAWDGNAWDEGPWGETSLDDGEWHHLVYRHAPGEGVSEIYLDGDLEASVEAGGDSQPSENDLGIGANNNDRDWFTGLIADVRLYDRPLSEDEIATLNAGDGGDGGDGGDENNLLANASFEEGDLEGWEPHTWGGDGEFAQGSEAYSGDSSAMLSSESGIDGSLYQDVAVETDTDYVLSGWIKTENIEGALGALLNVQNFAQPDTEAMAGPVSGTTDWEYVEWTFNTGGEDTIQVNCTIGGWDNSTGTAWYDDLSLVPADGGGGDPPTEFQEVAIAPEYSDDLEEGQDAPGELPGETADIELDLSAYVGTGAVQLRFEDYWPSDGWGADVREVSISADGEEVHSVNAPDDGDYLAEDGDSNGESFDDRRFADGDTYWIYEFDVPEDAGSLTATITIANGFRVLARAV